MLRGGAVGRQGAVAVARANAFGMDAETAFALSSENKNEISYDDDDDDDDDAWTFSFAIPTVQGCGRALAARAVPVLGWSGGLGWASPLVSRGYLPRGTFGLCPVGWWCGARVALVWRRRRASRPRRGPRSGFVPTVSLVWGRGLRLPPPAALSGGSWGRVPRRVPALPVPLLRPSS